MPISVVEALFGKSNSFVREQKLFSLLLYVQSKAAQICYYINSTKYYGLWVLSCVMLVTLKKTKKTTRITENKGLTPVEIKSEITNESDKCCIRVVLYLEEVSSGTK